MKKFFLLLALLISLPALGQNFTTVTATHIYGGGSTPLASGTMTWQAVDSHDNPISYQVGGGGQQVVWPTVCTIQNGSITGQCQVANTSLTNPLNICFDVTVKNSANQLVLGGPGSGYQCVQPQTTNTWCTAGSCNFDAFVPSSSGIITAVLPPPTSITLGGIYAKSCSGLFPLVAGYDTNGNPICASGSGGLGDPGANGIVKRTALDLTAIASGSDIGAAFSGCSVSQPVLGYDGVCRTNGTLNGVTAGTGLSGGGSSGTVTLSLSLPTALAQGGVFSGTCTSGLVATGYDTTGHVVCAAGSAGLADPGSNGIVKRTALNLTAPAAFGDVAALFAGCNTNNPALGFDGNCRPLGSITGITAGTGLTGGGNSGVVTVALANPIASNTTGNAATATALQTTPLLCPAGQSALGILANGNATGCFTPAGSTPTGTGFFHVTSGVGDSAARSINLATSDVTGILPAVNVGSGYAYSNLAGAPSSLPPSGIAGGDLAGSYPNPTVNPINLAISTHGGVTGTLPASQVGAGYAYGSLTGAPTSLPPNGAAGGGLGGTYPNPTVNAINLAITGSGGVTGLLPYTSLSGAPGSLPPNGPAGGDLSGTYPNPTVANVNGLAVPLSATLVGTNASRQLVSQTGTISNNTTGSSSSFTGALAGDVTGTQGTTSVVKVNGASVPTSATLLGSNGLNQLISQTGTIANNTSGNAGTATALATAPTPCSAGQAANGVDVHGNSTGCFTPGAPLPLALNTSYVTQTFPNDTVTGTTCGLLVSLTSAGQAIITPAGATSGVVGVAVSGCGITGNVVVATSGQYPLILDGAITAGGDYIGISPTNSGQGVDVGNNPSTGQTVGQALSLVSGTTYNLSINPGGPNPLFIAPNVIINNPNTAQVIKSLSATVPSLGVQCPTGAAATLNAFYVLDPSGNPLLTVTCGGTFTVGTGVGSVSAGSVYGAWCPVTYSASLVLNALTCKGFVVTLTGDVTSITLSNMPSSTYMDEIVVKFVQDATGGRRVSGWSSMFKGIFPRAIGRIANTSSTLEFKTDGTYARYQRGEVNQP